VWAEGCKKLTQEKLFAENELYLKIREDKIHLI